MMADRSPDGRCARCGKWNCHHLYTATNHTGQSGPHVCPPYSEDSIREDERQRIIEQIREIRSKELASVDTTTRQAYAVEVLNETIAAIRGLAPLDKRTRRT